MKIVGLLFLSFFGISALSSSQFEQELKVAQSEKVQLHAYRKPPQDAFNKKCILCTPPNDYAATVAFTKHWKITYWANQAYLGRSLIISQRHFGSYEEMTDEEAREYREILRQYLPALKKTFGVTHFNVAYLMNQAYRPENRDSFGEANPHFHWHIIPRYEKSCTFNGEKFSDPDFGDSFDFHRKQYLEGAFQQKAIEAIRSHLDIVYFP